MKLTVLIFLIISPLVFGSPLSVTKSPSITDSIIQLLSIHFGPILQNTLQQLIHSVIQLAETVFHSSSGRSGLIPTAPWVSDMFSGMNSIALQWNQHISNFFTNIPTEIVGNGRVLLNSATIKERLDGSVKQLLIELQQLFLNEIHRLLLSLLNKYHLIDASGHFDRLFNDFQLQITTVFDHTREQLNHIVNQSTELVLSVWTDFKDRLLG